MKTEIAVVERISRADLIAALIKRDGTTCQYPGCDRELDFTITDDDNPMFVTIDHWMPKHYGLAQGWTWEKIWDLKNLKLMEKKCNAKKGDLIPFEDGTLPARPAKTFRSRRQKRVNRPEICEACNAGRSLGEGEWCNACGTGGATEWWKQKWRQEKVKDCDHDLFYCVSCTIWFPEQRRSALDSLLTGGEGYE